MVPMLQSFIATKRVFCYLFVYNLQKQITTGDEKQLLAKKLAMNWIKAGNVMIQEKIFGIKQ